MEKETEKRGKGRKRRNEERKEAVGIGVFGVGAWGEKASYRRGKKGAKKQKRNER